MTRTRRLPFGAECSADAGVSFRVWAPKRTRVDVVLEGGPGAGTRHECTRDEGGYFAAQVPVARDGSLYRFRLDGGSELYPDPASRAQPSGPHGPSEVVDPSRFAWSDGAWKGVDPARHVLYEMHVGTFTREGTWAAAMKELPELARLGVTILEVMPIADFPGRFGWGYDGVNLFAPTRLYGTPDDARRFVDRAHALGLGVILDVVYNHFGPDGNYLPTFSDTYFNQRLMTDWGAAINYDAEGSGPVRELVTGNAGYWVDEFHFDGLRLDATQEIHDTSADHIVAAIARAVRHAAPGRRTFIVAEDETETAKRLRAPDRGGDGLDAMWNDDWHHTALVALTGHREAYYSDYGGTPQELVSALKHGFLYQGQRSTWQNKRRGAPAFDVSPRQLVSYLENHDQVANTASGLRVHAKAHPGRHRALVTLLLLGPSTPMLFQGEEFAASSPFLFFADHEPELAGKVREGRREFLRQFPSIACPAVADCLPAPDDGTTFERCKLDFAERDAHATAYAFFRDAIALRHGDEVFGTGADVDGAVLGPSALAVRFFGPDGDDRLIVVNLGADVELAYAPEPLLAPPEGRAWEVVFSSEDPLYGGAGTPPPERDGAWFLLGEAAVVLRAAPRGSP